MMSCTVAPGTGIRTGFAAHSTRTDSPRPESNSKPTTPVGSPLTGPTKCASPSNDVSAAHALYAGSGWNSRLSSPKYTPSSCSGGPANQNCRLFPAASPSTIERTK